MFPEDDASLTRGKGPGKSPYTVVEMYLSLGLYAIYSIDTLRDDKLARGMLGRRKSRWLVIGHPDSMYGIILGKRTTSRWLRHVSA